MSELLLLGSGVTGWQYLVAARRLGVRIHLVETEAQLATLGDLADEVQSCPGALDEHWVQAALTAAGRRPPDGVVAFGEPQVLAAAMVASRFGLPGVTMKAAVISRNKALQRACFAAACLPQPEFTITDALGDAAGWAVPRLPVVVKALDRFGSDGVELVATESEFAAVAARRAGEGRLLVERAVEGPEFSWEGFVSQRQVVFGNVTAKETTGPPHFVEVEHRVGRTVDSLVSSLAEGVVRALDMDTGIVHLEYRRSAGRPVIMEVAVRTPGDHIMDAIGLAYRFDAYEAVVRLALGLPLEITPHAAPVAAAGVLWLTGQPGKVTSVEGVPEVSQHPAVVATKIAVRHGDVVAPLRWSQQRLGHVLLTAPSAGELDEAFAFVKAHLKVRTLASVSAPPS